MMPYVEITYGSHKKEIRALLRERLKLKERRAYHLRGIRHHEKRIEEIEGRAMVEVNEKIDYFLSLAKKKGKVSGKDI